MTTKPPLFILLLPFLLEGCFSPYASQFDCPEREGLTCASLTKVNRAIDQGDIDTGQILELEKSPPLDPPEIYFAPSLPSRGEPVFYTFEGIY
jgi:hypothetical protein